MAPGASSVKPARVSVGRRRVLRGELANQLTKTALGTVIIGGLFSVVAWAHHTKASSGVAAQGGRHVAFVVASYALGIGLAFVLVFLVMYNWKVRRPKRPPSN